jgi:hypothetical protein
MKPTPEQAKRMRFWLEERADAILKREYSPVLGSTLQADIESGVDFSDLYAEFGFASDGDQLLPNVGRLTDSAARGIQR